MSLSRELIEQFQQQYLEKFNAPINYETAEQELREIAQLVRIASAQKEQYER